MVNRAFHKAVERYRSLVDEIAALPELAPLVQKLVDRREGPSYTVDTAVVFNRDLDELSPGSIKMILVADNPGRREQAAENRRYLVGPSGKIAEKFFRDRPELGIDFRKNVLILNKTPIHTPRTAELKDLCGMGKTLAAVVASSQRVMAELLGEFYSALAEPARPGAKNSDVPPKAPFPVWIIGYSEMKKGGIFEVYTNTLISLCASSPGLKASLYFYRHFSMNSFTTDLKQQARPGESAEESLERIGTAYRERVLG
ncbi:MAG: hypothetical protein LBK77_01735 [Spirochaetaceae bacterium]|jgi:hypothetical protein|nr:hypothetical protein [Spirochaetaceae bacterium]